MGNVCKVPLLIKKVKYCGYNGLVGNMDQSFAPYKVNDQVTNEWPIYTYTSFFYVIEPEIADTMVRPYIRFSNLSIFLASKNGLTKHMNIVYDMLYSKKQPLSKPRAILSKSGDHSKFSYINVVL